MTVLEIGSDAVRVVSGPGAEVDRRLAAAALQWIDEPVGLYDDRPVAVADLWRAVMAAAAAGEPLVLIHPDDWADHRIARVVAAGNSVADEVVAVPRRHWSADFDGGAQRAGVTETRSRRKRFMPLAAIAGVLAVLAVAIGLRPSDGQTVVEGRIAVRLPADWTVSRVTGGPGSRRLQATAPGHPELAVHVTQSYAPESTLADTAKALSGVIAAQSAGVFVDMRAEGRVGGRPAVTYREVRPGKVVDWSVLLVGSTLIGIGCQSPPQRIDAVRGACTQAVTSVRESGTDPRP